MPPKASTSAAGAKKKPAAKKATVKSEVTDVKPAKAKLGALEKLLYESTLDNPARTLTLDELISLAGEAVDTGDLMNALNLLLKKNLFRLGYVGGKTAYTAISEKDAKDLVQMDITEKLVLETITAAGNLGIWTKTLKAKTGVHQTLMAKALKTLESKKLIKAVKSVKNPTRKIYMLERLQPSIELTGGPWFTNNELDTEFVATLQQVCYQYVQAKSFPGGMSDYFYPVAYSPFLPTAPKVLEHISSTKVTDQELLVEHVEALLDALVWDGKIERISMGRYEDDQGDESDESPDSDDSDQPKSRKRKRKKDESSRAKKRKKKEKRKKKKKRREAEDSDDLDDDSSDSDSDSSSESDEQPTPLFKPEDDDDVNIATLDFSEAHGANGVNGKHSTNGKANGKSKSQSTKEAVYQRPGPPGKEPYFVYRALRYHPTAAAVQHRPLGILDNPCGLCPVQTFCDNRGRPEPIPPPGTVSIHNDLTVRRQREKLKFVDIRMKPTSRDSVAIGDTEWLGGGTVGGNIVAPVNPENCTYFKDWLAW